jgi:hypothetical protein
MIEKMWVHLNPYIDWPEHNAYYDVLDMLDEAMTIMTLPQRRKLVKAIQKNKIRYI